MLCLPWKKTDLCTPPDTRIQEGLTPGIRRCVSPFSCSFTVSFSFTIRYILRCFSLCFSIFPGCFPSFSLLSERKPQDKVTPPQRIFSVLLFSGFPETVHKQIQRGVVHRLPAQFRRKYFSPEENLPCDIFLAPFHISVRAADPFPPCSIRALIRSPEMQKSNQ